MNAAHKKLLTVMMSVALAFGFLQLFLPDVSYDFGRLHIFLFNLCSGGFVLLYLAGGRGRVGANLYAWLVLSVAYAVSAFFNAYEVTLVLSVFLFGLVEQVRIKRFSLLPFDFFRPGRTRDKFLHSALLCLSCGIVIASLVILNSEYFHLVQREKLTIDVFFLGYSFPLSLVTFSVMFSFFEPSATRASKFLRELSFWWITVGVVVFFAFIILEWPKAEVAIGVSLVVAVCLVYGLFIRDGKPVQQRIILLSGMGFLLGTGATGVWYLLEYVFPSLATGSDYLLTLHATVALYGWNLSGLLIIVRWEDFPITRHTPCIIGLHWAAVLVLAPIGMYVAPIAFAALAAYTVLLWLVFFGTGQRQGNASIG